MWEKHEEAVINALTKDLNKQDLLDLLDSHREKISFIQHERLMHLLVMMTVILCTLISVFATFFSTQVTLLIPDLMLTALFIAYLIHYRKLENTTQRWYVLVDKIKSKLKD